MTVATVQAKPMKEQSNFVLPIATSSGMFLLAFESCPNIGVTEPL